jgi:hypothetical protein
LGIPFSTSFTFVAFVAGTHQNELRLPKGVFSNTWMLGPADLEEKHTNEVPRNKRWGPRQPDNQIHLTSQAPKKLSTKNINIKKG